MIIYTSKFINITSTIISIIIYICVNFLGDNFKNQIYYSNSETIQSQNNLEVSVEDNIKSAQNIQSENTKEVQKEDLQSSINAKIEKESKWYVKIPAINLIANIAEGTEKDTMNKYVGHFNDTSKNTGIVGLAAHNRGYENNYFADLKKLKEGDEIIYKCNDFQRTYIVKKHVIIKDTDWSYLEETKELKENKITLITCVENEPTYRRCIQGIEKK